MSELSALEWLRVGGLSLAAAALLVGLVRYQHHVVHRSAVAALVTTLLVLAASVGLQAAWGSTLAVEGLQTLVAAGFLATTWLFANEFVNRPARAAPDPVPPDLDPEPTSGGFEDAERD